MTKLCNKCVSWPYDQPVITLHHDYTRRIYRRLHPAGDNNNKNG